MTDWSRYRTCPVCFALLGEPCLVLTGRRVNEEYQVTRTGESRDRPHTGRELRAAAAREEASRG
jgi:hypothetical protein